MERRLLVEKYINAKEAMKTVDKIDLSNLRIIRA